jgi:hypothetical protein
MDAFTQAENTFCYLPEKRRKKLHLRFLNLKRGQQGEQTEVVVKANQPVSQVQAICQSIACAFSRSTYSVVTGVFMFLESVRNQFHRMGSRVKQTP